MGNIAANLPCWPCSRLDSCRCCLLNRFVPGKAQCDLVRFVRSFHAGKQGPKCKWCYKLFQHKDKLIQIGLFALFSLHNKSYEAQDSDGSDCAPLNILNNGSENRHFEV